MAIDTRSAHRPCISRASISRCRSRSFFVETWPLFCCITSSSFSNGLVTNCVALCHAMAQFLVTWFAGVCVSFAQVYVRRSSSTLILTIKLTLKKGLIFNPSRSLHCIIHSSFRVSPAPNHPKRPTGCVISKFIVCIRSSDFCEQRNMYLACICSKNSI